MKKIILIIALFLSVKTSIAQSVGMRDSSNIQSQNFIYNNRTIYYIGHPMYELFNSIFSSPITFSLPDNIGSKTKETDTLYYKKFILYYPWISGVTLRGFEIEIADKVYLTYGTYRQKIITGTLDAYIKNLLLYSTITDIQKYH